MSSWMLTLSITSIFRPAGMGLTDQTSIDSTGRTSPPRRSKSAPTTPQRQWHLANMFERNLVSPVETQRIAICIVLHLLTEVEFTHHHTQQS